MMTRDAYNVPSWAIAILFWRRGPCGGEQRNPGDSTPRVTVAWRQRTGRARREMNLGGPRQTRGRNGLHHGMRN